MSKPAYTVPKLSAPDWSVPEKITLTHTGWLTPCPIAAAAQVCHDGENLYVRMEAEEQPIKATLTGPLDQVCNDSCLEFFLAPIPGESRYFNFELNPLGTLYLGFGGPRPNRIRQVPKNAKDLFQIQPFTTETGWGVTFRVPLSFLRLYYAGFTFTGETEANFYKCGDQTPVPHYLAWSPLSSETPDYHRPQDFGRLIFEA